MKFTAKTFLRATVFAAVVACASQAAAQAPAGAPPGPKDFKILKLSDPKRDSRQSLQQKIRNVAGTSAKAKDWGVFDASFATAPEWIDGLVVTFTVVLDNPKADVKKGEPKLTLFQTSVEYPHVAKGNDHKVGVVLPPNALLRFGDPVGFAVQFSAGGQEIGALGAIDNASILKKVEGSWWSDPRVLEAPFLQKLDGYLVDRMKSPFLLVDIDSYEVSR